MKLVIQFILIFLFTEITVSQDHYPLQVGNLWQYWTYDYFNGQFTWYNEWTTKVVGDTLMPNGKTYFVLKADRMGHDLIFSNSLYRQEGSKVFAYNNDLDSEITVYDFAKTTGDTLEFLSRAFDSLIVTICGDQQVEIYGLVKRQWTYFYEATRTSFYLKRELTSDFGITYIEMEPGGEWFLYGAFINGVQYGTITSVNNNFPIKQPADFEIFPSYPNPFNASTTISFYIEKKQDINISIYDILGRKVASLLNSNVLPGLHKVVWNGKGDNGKELASGMYLCRLQGKTSTRQVKVLMIK